MVILKFYQENFQWLTPNKKGIKNYVNQGMIVFKEQLIFIENIKTNILTNGFRNINHKRKKKINELFNNFSNRTKR